MLEVNYPLVTVIKHTHNRAHLIGRAIKSVLEYQYTGINVLNTGKKLTHYGLRLIFRVPMKKSRTLRLIRDRGRKLLISLYTRHDVALSKLRITVQEVHMKEGWGGKDISVWPPYEFYRAYLNGQHEASRTSYYNWILDQLIKYHNVPNSKGGFQGGSVCLLITRKYAEKNIDFHGDIFLDFDVVSQCIKEKVDSRFALLEAIRKKGFDSEGGSLIKGIEKEGCIYVSNGHHRWAILKLLGYNSVPKIRLKGIFDGVLF